MKRQPNTEYVLSLSYGKDSIACIEAIYQLGLPLDRIIHAEVWATDTIPADLPPMVEFKKYADQVIKFRYGIDVEHIYATREREREREKLSYEKQFYTIRFNGKYSTYQIYGFPCMRGQWCTSRLKTDAVERCRKDNIRENVLSDTKPKNTDKSGKDKRLSGTAECSVVRKAESKVFSQSSLAQGAGTNIVQYLGIAADEPERIKRHSSRDDVILPLVLIGWNEDYCRQWCEDNLLLAPTYSDSFRGGCWFCHNQSVGQLRLLRKKYPEYWELLLKWDNDSPVTFKPDGHTVHDYEIRFAAEDKGLIVPGDSRFRWKQVL